MNDVDLYIRIQIKADNKILVPTNEPWSTISDPSVTINSEGVSYLNVDVALEDVGGTVQATDLGNFLVFPKDGTDWFLLLRQCADTTGYEYTDKNQAIMPTYIQNDNVQNISVI